MMAFYKKFDNLKWTSNEFSNFIILNCIAFMFGVWICRNILIYIITLINIALKLNILINTLIKIIVFSILKHFDSLPILVT